MCNANRIYSILIVLLILGTSLSAQYNRETVTEKSFENSDIFFNSHFLNPFGVESFKTVAIGLIDNPFLSLQQNPANLPQFNETSTLLYLDFRGDRSRNFLTESYAEPLFYDDYAISSYIDPRWYSSTRERPEPVFSLGLLRKLSGDENSGIMIGGTYQLVYREDPFYQIPNWIYYSRFGYDELSGVSADLTNVPITDVANGTDELLTTGHFYSGFLTASLNERLNVGVSLNGVQQELDGLYGNLYRENNSYNNNIWQSFSESSRDRLQDYSHWDLAAGLTYKLNESSLAGIKVGFLDGTAKQAFNSQDTSFYNFGTPQVGSEWSLNSYRSDTRQSWDREGDTRYVRIHYGSQVNKDVRIGMQYRFEQSQQDLLNSSIISDSSDYDSRWENGSNFSEYQNRYTLSDSRSGSGDRERLSHLAQLSAEWKLSPKTTITAAATYLGRNTDINSIETVLADRSSFYRSIYNHSGLDSNLSDVSVFEDKTLDWTYSSEYWSLQVPVIAEIQFNKTWRWTVGINRILESWRINEETVATFKSRVQVQNGNSTTEENFAERYVLPRERITEQSTDFITSIEAALSDKLSINLLVDPDFSNDYGGGDFRIAQWWLGFKASL